MRKFRKLPDVIEAARFQGDFAAPEIAALGGGRAFDPGRNVEVLTIATPDGLIRARPGDWILRGPDGDLHVCTDAVFARRHEPVDPCACGRVDCFWCQR